jgi:uncharacterized protein involved in exopolysaccharide biosynthesis
MERSLRRYEPEPEVAAERTNLHWRDVTAFLRRYRMVIASVFVLTVLGTYVTLSMLTEKYDTSAAVIVKLGRENVDPPPTARNTNVFSGGLRHEEVMSETEFMRSPDLIRAVVHELGPDAFKPRRVVPENFLGKVRFYAKAGARWVKDQYRETLIALNLEKRLTDEEKAGLEVEKNLAVVYQKDSDVIDLTLRIADPALARTILSRLLDAYTRRRIQVKETTGTEEFLSAESRRMRDRLDSLEAVKQEWKQSRNLSSPQDQRTLLLRQIRDVIGEHDGTLREASAIERQLEETRQLLAQTPEQLRSSHRETPDPSAEALRQRLTVLESERAHLLTKYDPSAAQVKAVEEEIASVKELVRISNATAVASVTYQVNPLHQELERKVQDNNIALQGLLTRASLQEKQLASLQAELRDVDSADSRLQSMERESKIAETEYMTLVERRQQADIDTQLDRSRISNVSILTPPTSGIEVVYPRKLLLMGIAIGLGLVLGVGLSLLLNYMDENIHDWESAEAILQTPCLGQIEPAKPAVKALTVNET